MEQFLPVTPEELISAGVTQPDFVYITGDAYVDHPSFGVAIISRVLAAQGYSVAILPQPNWRSETDFLRFGRPRLGFLVTAGNIDSMVAHYTAAKKRRSDSVDQAERSCGESSVYKCAVFYSTYYCLNDPSQKRIDQEQP